MFSLKRVCSLVLAWLITFSLVCSAGIQASASAPIKLADIYSHSRITQVLFDVPSSSEASLNNWDTLAKYVPAKVKFVSGELQSEQINIGMRLKGTTSLQPLQDKPSIKIKFNWGAALKGQRFLGLKGMTLNSMSQDGSWLHEFASYKLYNSMGVVAPATGWAEVFVNGKSKGIYVNVETPDDVFLGKRFTDTTQHLYEGQAWADLKPGNDSGDAATGKFTVDEGWKTTPNKNDLSALIKAASVPASKAWWDGLSKVVDRNSLIKMFAVDNLLGNWDAYSGPIVNNYFLRSNSKGQFTFIPWGTDQTFGENRQTQYSFDTYRFAMDKTEVGYPWVQIVNKVDSLKRGLLFTKCLAYKPCQTQYFNELRNASSKVNSSKLSMAMVNAADVVDKWTDESVKEEQMRTIKFLTSQQKIVVGLLAKYKIK
jgi:spore coat protein CotH